MNTFPNDFKTVLDCDGNPMGGFGGNPAKSRDEHREFIRKSGKAPVILVHGNTGTATHAQWGWLKVVSELKRSEFGYSDEHFWALSYLGYGERVVKDAYTANVEDLRRFTDYVREYLGTGTVDMVGHSLGCFLILCYLSGLKHQSEPIVWDEGERYSNVGTVVLIDGAMKGLSQFAQPFYSYDTYDEWLKSHDIYNCLTPDNTPYGKGDVLTPAPPDPHHITYWCCMVPGGYVDQMDNFNGTTGHLEGADQNRNYNVGTGVLSHEKVKDEAAIIRDWASYLNSVPPVEPVVIGVDLSSGDYALDAELTVSITPQDKGPVRYSARKVMKSVVAGHIETESLETADGRLMDGQTLSFPDSGMWEVTFEADGAANVYRTYGIGIKTPVVKIITDNTVPFQPPMNVQATADSGAVFMNNGGSDDYGWLSTTSVTISETCIVKAMAINVDGAASEIVSEKFEVIVKEQAKGTAAEHYVAGRLDVNGLLHYGSKYGYMQSFTLYRIDGVWTDAPDSAPIDLEAPVLTCSHESGAYDQPIRVSLTASDNADPAPRIYYTLDGSTPSAGSLYFANQGVLEFNTEGIKTLQYMAADRSGNTTLVSSRTFEMNIEAAQPLITANPSHVYHDKALTVTVSAADDIDNDVTVYYTTDGTVPDVHSSSFVNTLTIPLVENGNHAISCYAKDSAGRENRTIFHYVIQDSKAPVTSIYPLGGMFSHEVEVSLSTNEPVLWIKYTTDGSSPDDENGTEYLNPFMISQTTLVTFRAKDTQGNMEEVRAVPFTRNDGPMKMSFENMADIDGYIKASQDGNYRSVVDDIGLAVGSGWDGRISRAIISFDTSALPQEADITRAFIQVKYQSGWGDPWDDAQLKIDVKKGKFGSDTLCQTGDWDEEATATGVAEVEAFFSGAKDSSDFNAAGCRAINRSGRTQMRLYFDPHENLEPMNYVFFEKGADIRLFVDYETTCRGHDGFERSIVRAVIRETSHSID